MTKKTTKRALLTSCMSMLLCVSMLIGSTFAWFTDNVTSTNNIIKSGNLDVEFEYWNGTTWVDVSGKADILTNELWEPGVTEIAYLKVANAGSLALKYQLGINIVSETAGKNVAGKEFKLSDYLMFGVVENVNGETGAYANREAAVAAVTAPKKISAGYTKESQIEASSNDHYFALVVYMPTTVDNVANHNGTDVPEINLGLNVFATQLASESDSFGSDYDNAAWVMENADYTVTDANELSDALEEGGLIALAADIQGDVTLDNIADDTILNFAGNTINGTVTVAEGQAITINGDGGISATGTAPAIKVGKNTDVTVAGGTFTSERAAFSIANTKSEVPMTLTIEEGTVVNAQSVVGLDTYNGYAGAEVVVNGGEFNTTGSSLKVDGGNVTINGGTFTINTSDSYKSFVIIDGKYNTGHDGTNKYVVGSVVINGGTFKSNSNYTKVVYASPSSSIAIPGYVEINGGTFECDQRYCYLVDAFAKVVVNDCTYKAPNALYVFNGSNNNATDRAIEVNGGNYTLRTNGSFVSSSYNDYITLNGGIIQ